MGELGTELYLEIFAAILFSIRIDLIVIFLEGLLYLIPKYAVEICFPKKYALIFTLVTMEAIVEKLFLSEIINVFIRAMHKMDVKSQEI